MSANFQGHEEAHPQASSRREAGPEPETARFLGLAGFFMGIVVSAVLLYLGESVAGTGKGWFDQPGTTRFAAVAGLGFTALATTELLVWSSRRRLPPAEQRLPESWAYALLAIELAGVSAINLAEALLVDPIIALQGPGSLLYMVLLVASFGRLDPRYSAITGLAGAAAYLMLVLGFRAQLAVAYEGSVLGFMQPQIARTYFYVMAAVVAAVVITLVKARIDAQKSQVEEHRDELRLLRARQLAVGQALLDQGRLASLRVWLDAQDDAEHPDSARPDVEDAITVLRGWLAWETGDLDSLQTSRHHLSPDTPGHRLLDAALALEQDAPARALEQLADGSLQSELLRSRALTLQGRVDEASESLQRLWRQATADRRPHFALHALASIARRHRLQGCLAQVEQCWSEASRLGPSLEDPALAWLRLERVHAWLISRELASAERELDILDAASPPGGEAQSVVTRLAHAAAAELRGDLEAALSHTEAALMDAQTCHSASLRYRVRCRRARLLLEQGTRAVEARPEQEDSLPADTLDPDDARDIWWHAAIRWLGAGEADTARDALEGQLAQARARELLPDALLLARLVARACRDLGDEDAAQRAEELARSIAEELGQREQSPSREPQIQPRPPESPEPSPLSPRELEVLQHAVDGSSNRDIAKALFVAEGTVKTHLYRVYKKLGADNRVQALLRAKELGLID